MQQCKVFSSGNSAVISQEDRPEDQLAVLSAAKVLADAAKKKVNTYTRRKRAVSTCSEGDSTASRIFSTAKESVSTAGESMPVSTTDVTLSSCSSAKSLAVATQQWNSYELTVGKYLRQTKKVYGTAYTKLILKVKKLEKTIKYNQARRRPKIIVFDDEEDSEDSSKHGRMIEYIDQDAGITLITHTKVISQEDRPEDQLAVLSAAKVLADAAKKKVNTYTRRRRAVSTCSEGDSTASRIFSTAKELVSTAGESMPVSTTDVVQEGVKDKEEQARFNAEQEAKLDAEQEELLASETTEDEANTLVTDVDRDDVQAQIQDDELAQKIRKGKSIHCRKRKITCRTH
nr:hypothetical protein [Tanacetum cinerariifolium]